MVPTPPQPPREDLFELDPTFVRTVARRARRAGWTAQDLAAQGDEAWDRFCLLVGAETATVGELVEVVDLVLAFEQEVDKYGTIG